MPAAQRSRKEFLMRVKSLHRESASSQTVDRRRIPKVAVARRIDSKAPTRVWSLLLPPGFRAGERK
jgi:hypothetical protein